MVYCTISAPWKRPKIIQKSEINAEISNEAYFGL